MTTRTTSHAAGCPVTTTTAPTTLLATTPAAAAHIAGLELDQRIPAQMLAPLAEVATRMWPAATPIGFPHATDLDFAPVYALTAGLNNIGDPTVAGAEPRNVKDLEQEVVDELADLFRAHRHDRWGCVTTGGTEGNLYGLLLARTVLGDPLGDPVVYCSAAAHYSVPKAAHILGLDVVAVPTDDQGRMDPVELAGAIRSRPQRPVAVVATAGTTMTEAVDDVAAITKVLDQQLVARRRRFVHVDAALSGIPLALLPRSGGPRHPSVNMASAQIDSLTISGHKFLGTPEPCGVLLTRRRHRDQVARSVAYIGGIDATIPGSRSGHTVLQLWWALRSIGLDAHARRAATARDVAAHAVCRLTKIGWPAWRHETACTVVLDQPPAELVHRWSLATEAGHSHIVCVPGVTTQAIDQFVADLSRAAR